MKKIKFISLSILLIFISINPMLAKEDLFRQPINIGASLNLNFTMHSPSFSNY
jgi:hypothetical protein